MMIIKTGSTLPELAAARGDFEDWTSAGLGLGAADLLVVDVTRGQPLPYPDEVSGVVITGSHDMVTDHLDWSERAAEWLRGAVNIDVPILGICYGHQLLAYALGGEVGDNPLGREYGTRKVALSGAAGNDPLLAGFDDPLPVQLCHTQSVLRLPDGARVLASGSGGPHQAFAFGEKAWGVQFHPEFDAAVVRAYIQVSRDLLANEGQDPDALDGSTVETPCGREILRRFARIAGFDGKS